MPQRVVVIWSCSLCGTETDTQDKVTQYQLSGGGRSFAYDICATCVAAEPFASILAAGLSEKAQGRASTPTPDGLVQCEFCEKTYTALGMGMHLSSAHGVKSRSRIQLENRGKSGKLECEDCGFRSNAPQGMAAHKMARHGVAGTSKTAAYARAAKKAAT